jgi:hypothetical protein
MTNPAREDVRLTVPQPSLHSTLVPVLFRGQHFDKLFDRFVKLFWTNFAQQFK